MSEIPSDVRAFMVANLDSVEALDVLLAMVRSRNRVSSATEISEVVGLEEERVDGFLAHFHLKGILEVEPGGNPGFRYKPAAPDLAAVIETLVVLHKKHRQLVLSEILGGVPDGVRAFSDAFRIRKKKGS